MKFKSYRNLTVLITGASSGIGEALAKELAKQNANLILVARRKERLQVLAKKLEQMHNIRVKIYSYDLSSPETPTKLYNTIKQENLQVDILINNAGAGRHTAFLEEPINNYFNIMDLNMKAMVHLTYLFLPDMVQRHFGGVLFTASIAGLTPNPYLAVYAATKSFIIIYAESLWAEFKNLGINITTLCPGPVRSEFFDAGNMNIKSFQLLPFQTPKSVAKKALKGLKNNKRSVQTNFFLRLIYILLNFLPTRFYLIFAPLIYGKGEKQ